MRLSQNLQSLNIARTKREELEKLFVEEWRKMNASPASGSYDFKQLEYMISPQKPDKTNYPSDRDIQIAETCIQWLGTSVGLHFLERVLKKAKEKGITIPDV